MVLVLLEPFLPPGRIRAAYITGDWILFSRAFFGANTLVACVFALEAAFRGIFGLGPQRSLTGGSSLAWLLGFPAAVAAISRAISTGFLFGGLAGGTPAEEEDQERRDRAYIAGRTRFA
jgi:hypothetical protein